MKIQIKLITSIILGLLILICSYQVYWLINFHNEQYRKLETAIMNAMNNADFREIATRIIQIRTGSDTVTANTTTIYKRSKDSLETKMPDVVIRIDRKNETSSIWDNADMMNKSIQQGIHAKIDSITSVDFFKFDSLLQAELHQLDIHIPYYLEYVDLKKNRVLMSSPADLSTINRSKYEEYSFPFTSGQTKAYHLYLKEPKWYIFKGMWGLVTVSALMLILLIISYIYLLKIILKQKTIDEIKGDFINNMTHELKTPISVTYAAIDTLQNFGLVEDPEKRDKYLDISKDQLMYLNSLVEQILTMSVEERKNLKISLTDIELYDLFENQKSKFLLNTNKPITINIDIKPKNLIIQGDKLHFGNILSNLIENAIKYSNDSVDIKLSAYQTDKDTVISICDNGIGISDGARDKIFDKFYRVSTGNIHNVKGYGLGLFYVKTIVDKHGWDIKVESMEGKGTCFKIIIK